MNNTAIIVDRLEVQRRQSIGSPVPVLEWIDNLAACLGCSIAFARVGVR
jgi:hypothetical protein